MRHQKSGRKLGRTSSHRRAMFRNLVTSLITTSASRPPRPRPRSSGASRSAPSPGRSASATSSPSAGEAPPAEKGKYVHAMRMARRMVRTARRAPQAVRRGRSALRRPPRRLHAHPQDRDPPRRRRADGDSSSSSPSSRPGGCPRPLPPATPRSTRPRPDSADSADEASESRACMGGPSGRLFCRVPVPACHPRRPDIVAMGASDRPWGFARAREPPSLWRCWKRECCCEPYRSTLVVVGRRARGLRRFPAACAEALWLAAHALGRSMTAVAARGRRPVRAGVARGCPETGGPRLVGGDSDPSGLAAARSHAVRGRAADGYDRDWTERAAAAAHGARPDAGVGARGAGEGPRVQGVELPAGVATWLALTMAPIAGDHLHRVHQGERDAVGDAGRSRRQLLPWSAVFALSLAITAVIDGAGRGGQSGGARGGRRARGAAAGAWSAAGERAGAVAGVPRAACGRCGARLLRRPAGLARGTPSALVPAFLVTELGEALQISLLILVPFVLVDLVLAQVLVLMGLGGGQSQPLVGLPLKIPLSSQLEGGTLLCAAWWRATREWAGDRAGAAPRGRTGAAGRALAAGGAALLVGILAHRFGLNDPLLVLLARAAAVVGMVAMGGQGWFSGDTAVWTGELWTQNRVIGQGGR